MAYIKICVTDVPSENHGKSQNKLTITKKYFLSGANLHMNSTFVEDEGWFEACNLCQHKFK